MCRSAGRRSPARRSWPRRPGPPSGHDGAGLDAIQIKAGNDHLGRFRFGNGSGFGEGGIVHGRCVTGLADLVLAKKRWGVSAAARAYRLHKLGILGDWQYRGLCIEMNPVGYRTSEPEGLLPERSQVWSKVFTDLWSERSPVTTSLAISVCRPLSLRTWSSALRTSRSLQ